MERPEERPEANPYEPPQAAPERQPTTRAPLRLWVLGIFLVPVAVVFGGCTACNGAMNADNGDVIGTTIGGGLVAGVIAIMLLFMVGSSRRP